MVRRAHIDNGRVVNISLVAALRPGDVDGTGAHIGDSFDGSGFTRGPRPERVRVADPAEVWLELDRLGLLAQAENRVNQAGGAAAIIWRRAPTFHRDHPMWDALANQLGLSREQMNDVFRAR